MRLYNSMTRTKEEFKPMDDTNVKIYSCGPTVYNYFHIGNARPFILFDTLRRYLEYRGYPVIFVQNFTDIDDKIIKKANEENVDFHEITKKYIDEYFIDAKGLNIRVASIHPRATENIDAMIHIIEVLIEKGYAYNVDGDVYFSTKKFKEYGKLSHQPLDDLEAGARIDVSDQKKDSMDFALWKKAKENEPSFDSPWGKGRPGWHIECSAMVNKYLGKTIDIHCGGKDLIFPHHENEIAQSEAANGTVFANYWLHNGYINIDNQKMSKSLGNFFTVRELSEKFDYEVLRFFMLQAHYRSPINFSIELMEQAKNALDRIYTCIDNLNYLMDKIKNTADDTTIVSKMKEFENNFLNAMDDDLNTADAIAVLFDLVKYANIMAQEEKVPSKEAAQKMIDTLHELGGVLGILNRKQEDALSVEIEELIEKRQEARKNKDFKSADEIRDALKQKGILLEDTPQGVKWKKE